jgi:RNA polymerase sigma-70 factor (ECF subfamily)
MTTHTETIDELRWIAATKRGETQAFAHIVKRYQDRLFNTLLRMVGHREEARDLTQQAFLRAYESLDRFRGGSTFYTWLYRIGVNLVLDERKRSARRPHLVGEPAVVEASQGRNLRETSTEADAPVDVLMKREREAAVTDAINSLDDLHRAVVVLRDIEGMDYDQIAEVLDCARGTVKSRLHRARLMLREKLEGIL